MRPTDNVQGRQIRPWIWQVLIAVGLLASGWDTYGAVPEQFKVWGTVGPEFRQPPVGWTEVTEEPDPMPALNPSDEERRRGFVLFDRDPFVEVYSRSCPAPSERTTQLRACATPGEYEPLALSVHALEDLEGLNAEVGSLRSGTGEIISLEQMDLRLGREVPVVSDAAAKKFRRVPFLLEKWSSFSVRAGRTAVLWLTIRIPDEAKPGEYTGVLTVRRTTQAATVQVVLRVLPFKLPPSPVENAMCYARPATDSEILVKELIDQREHGADVPVPAFTVQVKSPDRTFGPDDVLETTVNAKRQLGAISKVFGRWRFPASFEVGHEIAYSWDQGQKWFVYWKHNAETERDLAKAIDLAQQLAKSNGVPALRVQLIDEGGAHNLLEEAVYYNRWVKEHCPALQTTTTIGGGLALGHDEIGQLSGVVDFLSVNRFTPEIAKSLAKQPKGFGVYNGGGANPAAARFFFGFYGYKTGAQQILQWAYSFGESVFEGNGLRLDDEGFVYHASDGPLPSLIWEAVREGIDDTRYIELLRNRIAAAEKSATPADTRAAVHGRAVLDEILGKIGWGFQAMQSGDRTPAPHPSTLRKWRWAVAEEILALSKVSSDLGATRQVRRPSPLELPWAGQGESLHRYGSELLPRSDFEAELKPWRVEAWTGKGTGQLDSSERRLGKRSLRIDSPKEDGGKAVTVLVWPRYGENKLNLSLGGKRVYELSAWVKMRDRAMLPELRVNVPAADIGRLQTGQDSVTADGWQRLWHRVELRTNTEPSYLALWVQGPGTVWVEGLSLREITPPAATLQLDQDTYDALDKVALGQLTVRVLADGEVMRCRLLESDGREADSFAASPNDVKASGRNNILSLLPSSDPDMRRIVFSPPLLKAGSYSMVVEMMDKDQTVVESTVARFKRQ